MNMYKQLKEHEKLVNDKLNSDLNSQQLSELSTYNKTQIQYFQHERLIHLLVTLAFGICSVIVFLTLIISPQIVLLPIGFLLLVLLIPYIFHYYRLENGVQGLYVLDNKLDKLIGKI